MTESANQKLQRLSETQNIVLLSLTTPKANPSYTTKNVQSNPHRSTDCTQTDPIQQEDAGFQVDLPSSRPGFLSPLHFLKAATSTILELLVTNEELNERNSAVFLIRKYSVGDPPQDLILQGSRASVLSSKTGRVHVYTSSTHTQLVHSSTTNCFTVIGQYLVTGSTVGSLQLYSLLALDDETMYPIDTTDRAIAQNPAAPVVAIASYSRHGSYVLCVLDQTSHVSMWYIKGDRLLRSQESAEASPCYIAASSLALVPGASGEVLIGTGAKIFNASLFGAYPSPPTYEASSRPTSIQFNPLIPEYFAAAFLNGHLQLYHRTDSSRLLDLSVATGIHFCWSPVRASVLFAADHSGRLLIYDLLKHTRLPAEIVKIGSAIESISATVTSNGVNLGLADCTGDVNIFGVRGEYSVPLSPAELSQLSSILLYCSY